MSTAGKTAITGILLALALALAYIESLIPIGAIAGLPGIKLGLSNVVVLFAIYRLGLPYAAAIVVLKAAFLAMISGVMPGAYSLAGGALSLAAMAAAKRLPRIFSVLGVSIAGAAAHNIGQCLIAFATLGSSVIFGYMPYLLIAAVICGTLTGFITLPVLNILKNAKNSQLIIDKNLPMI